MCDRAKKRLCAAAACAVRVGVARYWNRSDFPSGQADPPHTELVCSNDACYSGAHVVPRQEEHIADTNDANRFLSHVEKSLGSLHLLLLPLR